MRHKTIRYGSLLFCIVFHGFEILIEEFSFENSFYTFIFIQTKPIFPTHAIFPTTTVIVIIIVDARSKTGFVASIFSFICESYARWIHLLCITIKKRDTHTYTHKRKILFFIKIAYLFSPLKHFHKINIQNDKIIKRILDILWSIQKLFFLFHTF